MMTLLGRPGHDNFVKKGAKGDVWDIMCIL